jgi:streptogramin lyase
MIMSFLITKATKDKPMKLIKAFLLLTCFLGLACGAFGAQVNSETAASVVTGWLRIDKTPFGESLGNTVKNVETFKDTNGVPIYYVVYLEPSGFVIVSAEDQVEPIIAFARQGHFDPSLNNPLGALVSKDVPVRVAAARANGGKQAKLATLNKWQKLQQIAAGGVQPKGIGDGAIDDLRVAPFTQTLWSQSTAGGQACYNFFTPPHEADNVNNYVCGCVATAMAQLMYYFQYPSVGVGTPSFTITVDDYLMTRNLRGGDGMGGPYDWINMPLDPSGGATPDERAAIGALTYDAGVAVHMMYTSNSSGAYMSDAKNALVTTFGYNNAVLIEGTNLDVEVDLMNMINPNMDARLPVLFGVEGTLGGHAIVCDGYGYSFSTLYHHLNLGWAGVDTAWYALPVIDLAEGSHAGSFFMNITACLYNVYTNGNGEIISGRVLDTYGDPIPGAGIVADRIGGGTLVAFTDANGIYALAGARSASIYVLTVTNTGYFPATSNYTTATSRDNGTNCGNIWGANFTLATAAGPPGILIQPEDQTVIAGSNATFSVTATGQLPLSYQWQYQPSGSPVWTDLSDDGHYSGTGSETLTVIQPGITLGEPFQCIVTNSLGSVTSSPAILIANTYPFIAITNLAGLAGSHGSSDGTNRAALFDNPRGISVDGNTNIYVADMHNHTIRKLTPSGTNWVVSTIAGLAGTNGSADGTNSSARFNGPYGIAVDGHTNIYVADTGNSTIRKLTPSGTNWVVSTMAGLATNSGSADGIGRTARFRYPTGVAVDSNTNVYVADEGNSTIRKLTPSGTNWVVSTMAGLARNSGNTDGTNSDARFDSPYGIAVDNNTNVYVADMYSDTIRRLEPAGANWIVSTIAGLAYTSGSADGLGSTARFFNPAGVAVDNNTNVYVTDEGNNTIRRLTLDGTNWMVFTVAGLAGNSGSTDGSGSAVRFNGPYGIAVDNNTNVYVADSLNNTIRGIPLADPLVPGVVQMVKQKTGNMFTLSWSAAVGRAYQVQFKTNLDQKVWSNLADVTASNWTGVLLIPVGTDPQLFYRIVPSK